MEGDMKRKGLLRENNFQEVLFMSGRKGINKYQAEVKLKAIRLFFAERKTRAEIGLTESREICRKIRKAHVTVLIIRTR